MEFCNVGFGTKLADFQGRNIFWWQITVFFGQEWMSLIPIIVLKESESFDLHLMWCNIFSSVLIVHGWGQNKTTLWLKTIAVSGTWQRIYPKWGAHTPDHHSERHSNQGQDASGARLSQEDVHIKDIVLELVFSDSGTMANLKCQICPPCDHQGGQHKGKGG